MTPSIDYNLVLKGLGYKNQIIAKDLSNEIHNCIKNCITYSNPKYCYRVMDIKHISESEIELCNSTLTLKSKNLCYHLRNASKVVVFAATLGVSFDNYLRISQIKSINSALILDVCASEYVESFCDFLQEDIRQKEALSNYMFLPRFSPGYGDFDISIQPSILDILNAQRLIGLTCSSTFIMLPRKSVSAIIGLIHKNDAPTKHYIDDSACGICQFNQNCELKKGGFICGRKRIPEK